MGLLTMELSKKNVLTVLNIIAVGIFLLHATPSMAAPTWEKTIDYGYPGYSETSSNWKTYNSPQAHDSSYRYLSHEVGNHSRTGTATWETTVPYCGLYKVSISYRKTENRTPDADYYVTANEAGGEKHFVVDQRSHHPAYSGWVEVGVFFYTAEQKVRVHLDGTDDGSSDCADAAHWELIAQQRCPGDVDIVPARSLLLK